MCLVDYQLSYQYLGPTYQPPQFLLYNHTLCLLIGHVSGISKAVVCQHGDHHHHQLHQVRLLLPDEVHHGSCYDGASTTLTSYGYTSRVNAKISGVFDNMLDSLVKIKSIVRTPES